MLTFGSVCSGIEAASVAWEPLGWHAVWFAEVDRAASEVLAYRFPDVPNHGDMTKLAAKVRAREIPAPDVLVGGTPCQAFSVAGMRRSLDDERGQLTLAFVVLADAIDEVRTADGLEPVIIVWENVPGVFTAKQNAFGCFLAGIAGEDDPLEPAGPKWTNAGAVLGPQRAIAWRTLDAQWFGLAQRRRRVFVVASARQGFDPAAILLEFDGLRRDSAPSREAGEGVTHAVAPCLTSSGRGVERTGDPRGQDAVVAVRVRGAAGVAPVPTWWDGRDVSQTLDAVLHKGQTMPEKNRFPAVLQPVDPKLFSIMPMNSGKDYKARECPVAQPLMAGGPVGGNQGGDFVLQPVAYAIQERAVCITGDVTHTLKAEGFDASEDGTGRGQSVVPAEAYRVPGNVTPYSTGDRIDALTSANDSSGQHVIRVQMAVRRLMPVECERLQGFPDNWTLVPTGKNGKPAADGPRYKQCGNSMATTVMHWIGSRIDRAVARIGHNGGPPLDDFEGLLGNA